MNHMGGLQKGAIRTLIWTKLPDIYFFTAWFLISGGRFNGAIQSKRIEGNKVVQLMFISLP